MNDLGSLDLQARQNGIQRFNAETVHGRSAYYLSRSRASLARIQFENKVAKLTGIMDGAVAVLFFFKAESQGCAKRVCDERRLDSP
jgi:hypothetical protein